MSEYLLKIAQRRIRNKIGIYEGKIKKIIKTNDIFAVEKIKVLKEKIKIKNDEWDEIQEEIKKYSEIS